MEWEGLPYPACEFPRGMSCFVLSPDKKLLGGGNRTSFSLFDTSSLVKVFGPVEVQDNINHLEFSPDGRFLFFGRLDKWFSVEKRCVEEFPQFLGKLQMLQMGLFRLGWTCYCTARISSWKWKTSNVLPYEYI